MMRKRNRLLVCLAAGVLILAVSATAAFGSVNGYTKYKEALKSLALETDNFTATGTMQVNYDGKEIASLQQDLPWRGRTSIPIPFPRTPPARWRRMTPCWTGCARSSI